MKAKRWAVHLPPQPTLQSLAGFVQWIGFVRKHKPRERLGIDTLRTGATHNVPIEPTLLPLLKARTAKVGGKGRFVPVYERRSMADKLRADLWHANVRRTELHASDKTRKNLTFHDLRATTATWYAVPGDDPLKIQRRLGHASLDTTQLYLREAENLAIPTDSLFPNLPVGLLADEADAANDADNARKSPSRSLEKTLAKPLSGKRVSNQQGDDEPYVSAGKRDFYGAKSGRLSHPDKALSASMATQVAGRVHHRLVQRRIVDPLPELVRSALEGAIRGEEELTVEAMRQIIVALDPFINGRS